MQCNMGRTDRILRALAGAGIIVAGIAAGSWWGVIGLIPLGTSLAGWCPAYVPLKINTKKS